MGSEKNNQRRLDLVIKISKFCNLRCKYCYEFKDLGDKSRISLTNLELLYKNVNKFVSNKDKLDQKSTLVNFIWHGGEPFLCPIEYLESALELQSKCFDSKIRLSNSIQTNLTKLDSNLISFLKKNKINLGVSFDVFGELRENVNSKVMNQLVLKNMTKLRNEEINFGCIVVLTKENILYPKEIYNFFKSTTTNFRILPLFEGAFEDQHDDFQINSDQIFHFLSVLNELWVAEDRLIDIDPLNKLAAISYNYKGEIRRNSFYNKSEFPSVLIINTNGNCQGYGDPYGDEKYVYGNIFNEDLDDLLESENCQNSIDYANERMAMNCVSCKYFGYCDGFFAAEAPIDTRHKYGNGIHKCVTTKRLLNENLTKLITMADHDHTHLSDG